MTELYCGMDLDQPAREMKAYKVDMTHRADEPGKYLTRWFDYSELHPVRATYLFASLYQVQTRLFCEAYIDARTSDNARAFFPDDIFMSRDLTSMWIARGTADTYGLPYDFVLQFAQQRALDRHFQCFMRPNQLYGEEFEIDVVNAWKEGLAHRLRYSRLPRYQASAPTSFNHKRHADFVITQVKGRPAPHVNLLGRLFHEGILDRKLVQDHFPDYVITASESAARHL